MASVNPIACPSPVRESNRARACARWSALVVLFCLSRSIGAQDVLWLGRLGTDTAVLEASRQSGSRITGIIVNVAAGLLVQRYEAELDDAGNVRTLRRWTVRDLAAPFADSTPSTVVEIAADSIRVTTRGPAGQQVQSLPAVDGAVPIFDVFFNNPMALMEVALRQAARRGDAALRVYFVGSKEVEVFALDGAASPEPSWPYLLARQYGMLAGARLHAVMHGDSLATFDARETTFKIVTERGAWTDVMTLARRFRERNLGAGGFSTMSPPRKMTGRVGPVEVTVTYGQPSRRGRRIFPDVVPFGRVWRAGANAATTISFSGDVLLDGQHVPRGEYSLWVLPGERGDTLIINKAARIWGVLYDERQDLVRAALRREILATPAESLTYTLVEEDGSGRLTLSWDDRRFSVRLEPAPGRLLRNRIRFD
jgi:hypothetical protein